MRASRPCAALVAVPAVTGGTACGIERVSVGSNEQQADARSLHAAISGDGRFVAFQPGAGNLVPGDTNNAIDVFVWTRSTGAIARVSVSSSEQQANGSKGYNGAPQLSADGRWLSWPSETSDLVAGDTNAVADVFLAQAPSD